MSDLTDGIEQLNVRKQVIQCEILSTFECGRSPADNEYIHDLHEKVEELRNLQFAINHHVRKQVIQCEILRIFENGRSPADNEYIHVLHEKLEELRDLQFAINQMTDFR